MSLVLPDWIEVNPSGILPGDVPIPDSSVKDRMQWRLKGTLRTLARPNC
jgi:hypothetical protein